MADTIEQIFDELEQITDAADKLRAAALGAAKQTDLEVAILTQQIADLREKNTRANAMIDESLSILGKLNPIKKGVS